MARSRATTALDWLALVLLVAAVAIALTGGVSVRLGGSRITARSPDRAALAALAVVALRVAIDRRTRPLATRRRSSAGSAIASITVLRIPLDLPPWRAPRGGLAPSRGPASVSLRRCSSFHSCSAWTRCRIWAIRCFRSGDRLGVSQARRRSTAAVQPKRVSPAPTDADLLGFDAPPSADDDAVSGRRDASGIGLQPGAGVELHRVGVRDVSPRGAPDRIARRRVRSRAAVWFLSLPVRTLQPLRAADDLLHAAGAAGAPPLRGDGAHAGRGGLGVAGRRAAVLVDVLRRVLHGICGGAFRVPLSAHAARASADARTGRPCRCARAPARAAARAHVQFRAPRGS